MASEKSSYKNDTLAIFGWTFETFLFSSLLFCLRKRTKFGPKWPHFECVPFVVIRNSVFHLFFSHLLHWYIFWASVISSQFEKLNSQTKYLFLFSFFRSVYCFYWFYFWFLLHILSCILSFRVHRQNIQRPFPVPNTDFSTYFHQIDGAEASEAIIDVIRLDRGFKWSFKFVNNYNNNSSSSSHKNNRAAITWSIASARRNGRN